jgi:pimeloyl-ACP methyl ester carboxylesterase
VARVTNWCRAFALTVLALTVVACGASAQSSTAVESGSRGLPSFYRVPSPLPSSVPGSLIKWEVVAAGGLDGTVYRVMYDSTTIQGKAVPVTGLVIVPRQRPPAGGYPVVTWAHGTNGMAEQCAPSLDPSQSVPVANLLLERGWEITASDYQGEGTPGLMPYLVGSSAARNTIDIVRAARHLAAAHASDNYVVWGHSEGGQTAMFALHIASSYAPELHLEGVVAGAPPSQFYDIYQFLEKSPFRYYLLMAAGGFHVAYGTAAPLSEILTPTGIRLLGVLRQGCADYVASRVDRYSLSEITKTNPFGVPAWQRLIAANDPGTFTSASPVPLLIIQGGADEQIPVVSTQLLAAHLCALGQDLERWIYPGQSHAGVIVPSSRDMVHWISDRFAGAANPDPYEPVGLPAVQVTRCGG